MRNDWNDDRLDTFSRETYRRFDEVDRRFDDAERNAERRSDEVNRRFNYVEDGIRSLNTRFDPLQEAVLSLHRMLFRASAGGIAVLLGILATQL